jgi:3-hydroxy acid dehydrogenase / malonic semialdehyde reductase
MTPILASKYVLVTGVTSGIGRATAQKLIEQGASVLGLGRDAKKLLALKEQLGPHFEAVVCDLADKEARERTIVALEKRERPIDVLINNAGECVYESTLSLPKERLARLFEVNVMASFELAQAVANRMRTGGHIVQLSSVTSRFIANARFAPYATTKLAIETLMDSLRWELHPKGIQVSTIVPGLVDTNIYDKVDGFGPTLEKLKQQVPEWLSPNDVADVICWTLSRPENVAVSEVVVLPRHQAR